MKNKKALILLGCFTAAIILFMSIAHGIQTSWGRVEVTKVTYPITDSTGKEQMLVGKLYRPLSATKNNKAPAVLMLHGYQNDKETNDAYSIELSRRGIVVLSMDEYGHGSTTSGLTERGWTNHKIKVNFGEDSEEDGTYKTMGSGGAGRYKIMMNFSNLSFFNDRYSKGTDGSYLRDSSMGGIVAYNQLANYDFVDSEKIGISGHSMGTWASWSTAAECPAKAVVLQCGELFSKKAYDSEKYSFNNVLLLQAKWDEFNYFRDYKNTVTNDLLSSPLRKEFLGIEDASSGHWNKTYGDFKDGSARRMELLYTNHRLTTHNRRALRTAIDWFASAFGEEFDISSNNQVFHLKEWLVFAAFLLAIFAMIPLMQLLLGLPFFTDVKMFVPNDPDKFKTDRKWWKGAIITMLIAGTTYPFMTQLGHGLLPLPEHIFRMTIGNGFVSWYLLLIVIMLITTLIPWSKSKKTENPISFYDIGMGTDSDPEHFGWKLFGKAAVLSAIMLFYVYILDWIFTAAFMLDFRIIWPFLKPFNLVRFGQFCIYFPIFFIFFLLNNSKIFAQMKTRYSCEEGTGAYWQCWWRNAVCMAGGLMLIVLLEYIPFFLGMGPGADLCFGTTFGGPFMSLLIVFVPQVIVFSLIGTKIYRETGNVFISAIVISAIATWVVTGGSSILY
ncbi:MAG: alpha/beta hydrolase [Treponema sp.]|nr:alpha/beta hydrolase [Treponema sp.]